MNIQLTFKETDLISSEDSEFQWIMSLATEGEDYVKKPKAYLGRYITILKPFTITLAGSITH